MSTDDYTKMLNEGANSPEFFAKVYDELKRVAYRQTANERGDVHATLLVNEVYLKLFGSQQTTWESRAHFFGAAAESMRRILIDLARSRKAQKRGGSRLRVTLAESVFGIDEGSNLDDLLDLEQALERLEAEDTVLAQLVTLRFFGGQTMTDIAKIMNMSLSNVERKWRIARAFLVNEMT